MKKTDVMRSFEKARDQIINDITAYVIMHGNCVKCDETERSMVSANDRYYLSREKFLELRYNEDEGLLVSYAYNPAQEDDPGDENGGWEICSDSVDMFSADELYNMIEDIIEEE